MLTIRKQQLGDMAAAMQRTSVVMSCELTWVSFQLVDEDEVPVAGIAYRFRLPTGSVQSGSLNAQSTVRYDGIPPGDCEIAFPELRKPD